MARARDETKVCTDLAPDLFVKFEVQRRASGLSRAAALRQVIERNLAEARSDADAPQPDAVPGTSDVSHVRVRVVPVPVRARDIARSPSANPAAIANVIAAPDPDQDDPNLREEMEKKAFLESPITHALLSGWVCSTCETPVWAKWDNCPVCGGLEVKKRPPTWSYIGLDDTIEKFRKPTVNVKS